MKRLFFSFLCVATGAATAFGQTLNGYTTALPIHDAPGTGNAALGSITSAQPLPMWNYSIVAYDGKTYTGTMIGRSPYNRGKATTTIPVQLIPLVITINNGAGDNVTYDPTAADTCSTGSGFTTMSIVTGSPLFQNNPWTMNGVGVGNTQYEDAVVRAEFWSLLSGSPYHLVLSNTTLAGQTQSFGSSGTLGPGTNYSGSTFGRTCPEGVVNVNDMDTAIQNLMKGSLASTVNIGTLPVFVTRNVVMAQSGTDIFNQCCILGYHSGFTSTGGNEQVYSIFSLDTNTLFGQGYTGAMSHELGEAIHDPTTNNPTPAWGNEGQVVGGCQGNFEDGDPLSPGFGTATNPFSVTAGNGLTYGVQELAFFNWFFGGTSLGAGGKYSNNGTFSGFAKACPPGGTN